MAAACLAQAQAETPLAFEVVSIKRFIPPAGSAFFRFSSPDPSKRVLRPTGSRFEESHATLENLVQDAYNVLDYQISGLPEWALPNRDMYDIQAKWAGDSDPTSDQLRAMLRTMLADRFQLKIHREMRDLPVYNLVVAKDGLKLKRATAEEPVPAQKGNAPKTTARSFESLGQERVIRGDINGLMRLISLYLDRPVLNKTNISGNYEYVWNAQDLAEEARLRKPAPSIFRIVRAFGLTLEPAKAATEIIVVDRAVKPSEN
ncbi:MAG TPA: TIGR03435 family protein [Candidatus Limnocylindrales bacterium]|nr:TIGR03435 family protein [Candidatus Limnocylindrales bacterium]